jgi:acyl-CoA dehydrogenase
MRKVVIDAMDIRAGAAICRGPRNVLARAYTSAPIAITVEGANILTRSMIIYGQGAIRCHPFVREEMAAAAAGDAVRFERAFLGHLGFVFKNMLRTLGRGLLGGRLLGPRSLRRPVRRLAGQLSRFSAAFALTSDVAMATVGGKLKRREKLSGRLADALAWMYLGTAALKKFADDGQRDEDLPLVRWALEQALYNVQEALRGLLDNLPLRPAAWALRPLVFPWGARLRPPSDVRGAEVAHAILDDDSLRGRLTEGIYLPPAAEPGLGSLEHALVKCKQALAIEGKIRAAIRKGVMDRAPGEALADVALAAGVITPEERARIREADEAREEVIQVDSFGREAPALANSREAAVR